MTFRRLSAGLFAGMLTAIIALVFARQFDAIGGILVLVVIAGQSLGIAVFDMMNEKKRVKPPPIQNKR